MQAPVTRESPFGSTSSATLLARMHWVSTLLLAIAFFSALIAVVAKSETDLPETWLLLLATVSTLVALARQLPTQNVWLAAIIIALVGGLAHIFGAMSGIPFGPFMFGAEAGLKLFGTLPWLMPLLWVVVVLNSRGVARLVLRPWRKMRTYGFWLIGLTALFTMLFDCALQPFAAHLKHYWIWTTGGFSLMPHGAPLTNSVGWFIVTLLILAFVTPTLINKQLSKRTAPDFHPLIVWLGGVGLFAVGAATQGLWPTVAVDGIIAGLAAVFAIRGGRW